MKTPRAICVAAGLMLASVAAQPGACPRIHQRTRRWFTHRPTRTSVVVCWPWAGSCSSRGVPAVMANGVRNPCRPDFRSASGSSCPNS